MNIKSLMTTEWSTVRYIIYILILLTAVSIGLRLYTHSLEKEIHNIEQEIYNYKNNIRL